MFRPGNRSSVLILIILGTAAAASIASAVAYGANGGEAVWTAPPVDVQALLAEDEAAAQSGPAPYRVGHPIPVDFSPANSGTWEDLPGGGQVWRLRIESEGALWISIACDVFRLKDGAELRILDGEMRPALGPFTNELPPRNNGQLWTSPVEGEAIYVELLWPEILRGIEPALHIFQISHGYKLFGDLIPELPADVKATRDLSGPCNIDIACPLGAAWQDEKRGVAHIFFSGSYICSGTLINNTSNDCTPYFLTANHCISTSGAASSTIFYFNYEKTLCGTGTSSQSDSVTGSSLVATYGPSDFTLLLLNSAPPASYDVHFAGWSRSSTPGTESTCIHHPRGDPKKITYNDDLLTSQSATHWLVSEWEQGTTEGGSSGSPLYDQNQRVVGQLTGGTASCDAPNDPDWFGKMHVGWDGGGGSSSRLSDWLDPTGTGTMTVDGLDHSQCLAPSPMEDLAVDFGSGTGCYIYYDAATWVLASSLSPESMTTGDLDGDETEELIADLGPGLGIQTYTSGTGWSALHGLSPEAIATGDLDGNGMDELIVDFGAGPGLGIYIRYNNASWSRLHALSPEQILTGDLDGSGSDELIIDFGSGSGLGLYVRWNDSFWTRLHALSPEDLVVGDLDGTGQDELIVDFGSGSGLGLYIYWNDSSWTRRHALSPEDLATGDLDGTGQDELIVDFGSGSGLGLYVNWNNTSWTRLNSTSPEVLATGDLDGTGADELIVDFGSGPGLGIYVYWDGASWTRLHALSPETLATGEMGSQLKSVAISATPEERPVSPVSRRVPRIERGGRR